MEIEEWLENLGISLNSEIGGYVMDLHHGDWTWSSDQDDWVLRSPGIW